MKFDKGINCIVYADVALFTRAWIEMETHTVRWQRSLVALFTRAWIEITQIAIDLKEIRSPSSRGRGLK